MAMVNPGKNPRRVAAGKQNGGMRRPWSDEERQRQRDRCLERQPWKQSTGPRTDEGKAISSLNGYANLPVPKSMKQASGEVTDVDGLIKQIEALRRALSSARLR
jgi:hypothetical protein